MDANEQGMADACQGFDSSLEAQYIRRVAYLEGQLEERDKAVQLMLAAAQHRLAENEVLVKVVAELNVRTIALGEAISQLIARFDMTMNPPANGIFS